MAQQVSASVLNNFSAGLKTEFTGLNFPEKAWTDAENAIPSIVGNAYSRGGFNFEEGFKVNQLVNRTDSAVSTFKWDNAGGDGNSQIVVQQVGSILYFYLSSNSTILSPLSQTLFWSVDVNLFANGSAVNAYECQYATGAGYLFVFHPLADPFYCVYTPGLGVIGNRITVQIRDFIRLSIPALFSDSQRLQASDLNREYLYNIANQGWGKWFVFTSSTSITIASSGSFTVTLDQPTFGTSVKVGDKIRIYNGANYGSLDPTASGLVGMVGFVTTVTSTTISFNTTVSGGTGTLTSWNISAEPAYLQIFNNTAGAFPANADTWWSFKDSTDVFDPVSTLNNVTNSSGPAPIGHFILNAFDMDRGSAVGYPGFITDVTTPSRPSTGCWFQGRLWFTGANASFPNTNDVSYYTWTENIYFSQTIESSSAQSGAVQFGRCYQVNDPTDETLFDILPSDGGVITIPGTGSIYKLFAIQNGLLVFAANGIWFITGSQGIGFSATDYTITKISNIKSLTSTSFINVLGYPMFWNEEGIYTVTPSQQGGGLTVTNLCLGTILTYYNAIPLISKKYARGDYDPVNYVIQWCFKSTEETSVTDRYSFDRILNLNTSTSAFYPYTFDTNPITLNSLIYVSGPGGVGTSPSVFKYLISDLQAATNFSFAEENDFFSYTDYNQLGFIFTEDGLNEYVDAVTNQYVLDGGSAGFPYTSTFTCGYQLRGQGQRRWQPAYVYIYSEGSQDTAYIVQGAYDYGRISAPQLITNNVTTVAGNPISVIIRRHKIRGQGLVFQMKISSVAGKPFNILGWSVQEIQNASV